MGVYCCISISVVCIYRSSPNLKQANNSDDDSDYYGNNDDRKEGKWKRRSKSGPSLHKGKYFYFKFIFILILKKLT